VNQLGQFLSKNTIFGAGTLPLVHSTKAFHLRSLGQNNLLKAAPCDVFTADKLNYFFVGRPAYKTAAQEAQSPYWQFPCCFIFEFSMIGDVRRMFPFDSGAFARKRYPSYTSMMALEEFEVAGVADAPGKIIGAFFDTPQRYFDLQPKGKHEFIGEYALGAMDMEIKALHRLSLEESATSFDDRRLTIEVQSGADVDLTVTTPLAVVAPSEFLDDPDFRRHVVEVWNATPISYSIGPLSVANAYGQIYEKVGEFYRQRGYL
jgi:hypothetical protein